MEDFTPVSGLAGGMLIGLATVLLMLFNGRIAGISGIVGGLNAWRAAGLETQATPALDIPGLAEKIENDQVTVLDVRNAAEWEAGHVDGSIHVPYQRLRDGIPDHIRDTNGKPLAVVCGSGVRSALAASLLRRSGVVGVVHVADGGVPMLASEGVELVAGT